MRLTRYFIVITIIGLSFGTQTACVPTRLVVFEKNGRYGFRVSVQKRPRNGVHGLFHAKNRRTFYD